ncbi:hypothetical protein MCEPAE42_00049 [Candidatus Nanopelagicaceae bacterium]
MSTKTTFKRVALVAVASLGLSLVAVAPSNAIVQADSLSLSAATASTTVGTAVTVDATVAFLQETTSDSMTLTLSYDAAPAGITASEVAFSSISAVSTDLGTPSVDTSTARTAKVSATTAASLKKTLKISLTPTKTGTYTIRVTPTITGSTVAPVSTGKTWTVTVAAKTIGSRSAFIGVTNIATETQTADAAATSLSFAGTASTTAKARLDVAQMYGATGNDTATAADGGAVVVSIDKGLVSKTNDYSASAASVTTAAATSGAGGYAAYQYFIFANGTVGKATITITVGGVALTSKTVYFTGAATALVATLDTGAAAWVKVGGTSTTTITATDSAGTDVTNPTGLTVKSSDTSVATAAIASGVVTVTGVKVGTATITVTDPATTAAATAVSYVATVAAVRPATAPTITFDAASYAVGSLVTMTVSANMGDSATAQLFTSTGIVLSAAVVASGTAIPTNGQHAIVGGKATYKFYAPAVSGSLVVSATTGGAVDITTAAVISITLPITNASADAAQAAAEEATAAANDATDAALSAAEAAEAATAMAQEAVDAVAELSAQVTSLISALRAQITALTNLVVKIQKKVKA